MLLISCPYCGIEADETELEAGGQAHITRAATGSSDAEVETYLFQRFNPKGIHFERWRHTAGCGKWFHAARHTVTLEVFGTYPAQSLGPPQAVLDSIAERYPEWTPER